MNFLELLNEYFGKKELHVYTSFPNKEIDIEKLKELGEVEEILDEENGYVTRTINFKSNSGATSFTRIHKYKKTNDISTKINIIDKKIEKAVEEEDYLTAAALKKKKIELLKDNK